MRIFEQNKDEGYLLVECAYCGRAHRIFHEEGTSWPQFVAAVEAMPESAWPGCCEEE